MAKASDFLIALDDGHGSETAGKRTPYIKSLGRIIHENEFNEPVVDFINEDLKRCGFRTLLLAPTDADTPLNTRVRTANNAKANLVISVHFNAMDGKFDGPTLDPSGFSAHVDPSAGESTRFAKIALSQLANGTKQKNRGVVEQNLAITRDTKMPAVLLELGFMDNEQEANLMLNTHFQKECANEIAKAVCEFYKVPYVEAKPAVVSKPVAVKPVSVAKPVTVKIPDKGYLGEGDKGDAVKAMQTNLNKVGYKMAIDGSFGPATVAVIKDFQRSKRLVVDGTFGPNTKKALDASVVVLQSPVYRVKVNGKQVGAYTRDENVLSAVADALKANATKIEISKA